MRGGLSAALSARRAPATRQRHAPPGHNAKAAWLCRYHPSSLDQQPVYRCVPSSPRWERLATPVRSAMQGAAMRVSFRHRFEAEADTVFFAFCYPWSYSDTQVCVVCLVVYVCVCVCGGACVCLWVRSTCCADGGTP
jgi:hypothetical protein